MGEESLLVRPPWVWPAWVSSPCGRSPRALKNTRPPWSRHTMGFCPRAGPRKPANFAPFLSVTAQILDFECNIRIQLYSARSPSFFVMSQNVLRNNRIHGYSNLLDPCSPLSRESSYTTLDLVEQSDIVLVAAWVSIVQLERAPVLDATISSADLSFLFLILEFVLWLFHSWK